MSMPNAVLDEPLTLGQQNISRGSGKAYLLIPLVTGFFCAVFFSSRSEVDGAAIDMRGGYMQRFPAATQFSGSCPLPGPPMSVNAMQAKLRQHGIAESPVEKFALTAYAATRDVSLRAQVAQEFSNLDKAEQAKLKSLQKMVINRAKAISPEDLPGVTEPLGFFDPAGFSANEENVAAYRRAELKHGRVCMLASLGLVVQEVYHPFFDFWQDGPWVSSVASHFTATASKNFWPAFWIMAAGHELATSLREYDGKEYADYGFDPLGLKPEDPEELLTLQNKELNNGRLAMHAAAGAIVQEILTGKSVLDPSQFSFPEVPVDAPVA